MKHALSYYVGGPKRWFFDPAVQTLPWQKEANPKRFPYVVKQEDLDYKQLPDGLGELFAGSLR